jgi:transposase
MTMLDVARLLGVGWDVVKDILKRHLHRRFGKPSLAGLEYIAIDEISVRKGHKYLTLVMDLRSGKVVFVGDGRGADSLKPFWERLKRSRARLRAVATDMSAAYIDKLTEVRRKLHRELQDTMGKNVLKGSRWILLKNPESLNPQRQEHERLQKALEANEPLAKAYYLKEELRQIWKQPNKDAAAVYLEQWIRSALASDVGPLVKMGKTMAMYRTGILAGTTTPYPPGPWKEPTTRSRRSKGRRTATGTKSSSNSGFWGFTRPSTL